MAEQIFYDNGGVKVTSARFIVYGETKPLAGFTSVSMLSSSPSRLWPIILIILGIILLFCNYFVAGIIIGIIGGVWLFLQKPTYHVRVETASGASDALSSKNQKFISDIVNALNDAIVERG